jgi:PKD repeat protein
MGGSEQDVSTWVSPTLNSGYIMSGGTNSNDGDVSGHHGTSATSDAWIVKLSAVVPTHCTAHFTIYPDTITPHNWFALNQATGAMPLFYLWGWGDGTSDTGTIVSHIYSSPGNYEICLQVSDASGCINVYCDSSTYIYKTESMVTVNVVNQLPTGIQSAIANTQFEISPNPFSSQLSFKTSSNEPTTVSLYNFLGQQVLQQTFTNTTTLNTSHMPDGIYFYELRSSKVVIASGKVVKQ